ncbi:MAG: hypothetical protein WCC22_11825 [Terriglobales bacterium]
MRILWVKADKLLPVDNRGNVRMDYILRYRAAAGDGGPARLASDGRLVQRNFAVGSGETVFCGEPRFRRARHEEEARTLWPSAIA